jgi:integrase
MARIAVVPPSLRHPYERYQVCYREGARQRSAGVFPAKRRAEAERRAIERGRTELTGATGIDLEQKARTLFGEYVATKW